MDKEEAEKQRAIGDMFFLVKGSDLGIKISEKLASIKDQAIAKTLRGDTPENDHGYYESRGKYAVVVQLEALIKDIENDYTNAVNWLTQNVVENSAPVNTDSAASTKVE